MTTTRRSSRTANAQRTFGEQLRALRLASGRAQADVARAIGVRTLSYGRWERDQQNPGVANRRALAAFFGVEPEQLGVGHEDPAAAGPVASAAGRLERVEHELVAIRELLEQLVERSRTGRD